MPAPWYRQEHMYTHPPIRSLSIDHEARSNDRSGDSFAVIVASACAVSRIVMYKEA